MNLFNFYQVMILPAFLLLGLGCLLVMLAWRASAELKQFIASASLLLVVLLSAASFIPQSARPDFHGATIPRLVVYSNPTPAIEVGFSPQSPSKAVSSDRRPSIGQANAVANIFTGLLSVVSGLLLLRLGISFLSVAFLRRRAKFASTRLLQSSTRSIRVVEGLSSPIALGGFRPSIFLPTSAESWSDDDLRSVIAHEEAHLENGDPNWQIVAEVACILFWFIPFAWILRSVMRQAAERAADNAVLRRGVQPSRYAEYLMDFAKQQGKVRQSPVWTTFARRSGMKGRIRSILNSRTARKPIGRPIKIVAVATISAMAYLSSAYIQTGKAVPTSHYDDIRRGLTTPANPSNGYVGKLMDGREVEVVQISRQMENGHIVAWKPDGTPLDDAHRLKHSYHPLNVLDTHTRYLVLRFPENKATKMEPNAGCGSGSDLPSPSSPSEMVFAGGGILYHKSGYYTIVSYVGLPKEDCEKFQVGFGISDGYFDELGTLSPTDSSLPRATVKEVPLPLKGDLEKSPWWPRHPEPYTLVEFDVATNPGVIGDLDVVPVFKDASKTFREDDRFGSFGKYVNKGPGEPNDALRCRYYFAYRLADVTEYKVMTRSALHCDVEDLAANPRSTP